MEPMGGDPTQMALRMLSKPSGTAEVGQQTAEDYARQAEEALQQSILNGWPRLKPVLQDLRDYIAQYKSGAEGKSY